MTPELIKRVLSHFILLKAGKKSVANELPLPVEYRNLSEQEWQTTLLEIIATLRADFKKSKTILPLYDCIISELQNLIDPANLENAKKKSLIYELAEDVLRFTSREELEESLGEMIQMKGQVQSIIVISPQKLDQPQKTEIRKEFQSKLENSFTQFVVNADLLGGLAVSINGQLNDHSWQNKIRKILN